MRFLACLLIGLGLMNVVYAEQKDNEIVTYTQDKLGITVTAKQPVFVIKLKSNPSTGYSWFLRDYDHQFFTPIKHVYQPADNKKLMGASGYEVWTFKTKPTAFVVPQQRIIRFVYARAWEATEQATQVVFRVSTY